MKNKILKIKWFVLNVATWVQIKTQKVKLGQSC